MRNRVRRLWSARGQSIVEWLVIATVIMGVIIAISSQMKTHVNTLYTNAANQTQKAATNLGQLKTE